MNEGNKDSKSDEERTHGEDGGRTGICPEAAEADQLRRDCDQAGFLSSGKDISEYLPGRRPKGSEKLISALRDEASPGRGTVSEHKTV